MITIFLTLFTRLLVLLLTVIVFALIACLAWFIRLVYLGPLADKLENMPGPVAGRYTSHLAEMTNPNTTHDVYAAYTKQYGLSWRFNGFGSWDYRLMTMDTRALSHILSSPTYEKPLKTRRMLSELLGRGVFAMEGDEHKRMRKIINPAFFPQSIKLLAPTFVHKAEELCRHWERLAHSSTAEEVVVDVHRWLGRAALDVIGSTGFGWDFHALKHENDGIYNAYRDMFKTVDEGPSLKFFLDLQFPWLPRFWADHRNHTLWNSNARINSWGRRVLEDDKRLFNSEKYGGDCKEAARDRTILRLLIKANAEEANPAARLSDDELLDQLSTFLFGGSDSLSGGIAWTLHLLSMHTDWQDRIRREVFPILQMDIDTQIAQLDCNSTLDHVVRESLRLSPPVHGTIRVATKDDRIPLSKPILKRNGKWEDSIQISKGSYIHIPIEGLNTSEHLWGPDADKFNPDRWDNPPQTARSHPGLANLMTFSFGPHACPGYRFAILETKIFIAIMVSNYVFKPEGHKISRFSSVVTRPRQNAECNATLPLRISRILVSHSGDL